VLGSGERVPAVLQAARSAHSGPSSNPPEEQNVSDPTKAASGGVLERYFQLEKHGTTVRTELVAGLTTFLAMAYIVFVNQFYLGDIAGMDKGAVFVATALAAAIGTMIMGVWAKLPIAQAPGMGLNAFFAFTVVLGLGVSWQTALAGTMVSGIVFLVLALTGVRKLVIDAIPMQLKLAVGAGIGLFIAFIGLKASGIVVDSPATTVTLGDLKEPTTMLAIFGIVVTAVLLTRGVRAAVFYGILLTSIAGMVFGLIPVPSAIIAAPPSLAPTFGVAFGELSNVFNPTMLVVVFTMLFVDFFDTAGTLIAVTKQADLLTPEGEIPGGNRPLVSDAIATVAGAALGTSTTTSYIESSAGVGAGGRTGLTSVATSVLFVITLFFSPILGAVTAQVTAAALIVVGLMMAKPLSEIAWEEWEYGIPAFIVILTMPLTYSIANGIALGLVLFPLLAVVRGKAKSVSPTMYALGLLFLAYFIFFTE
jgi:AGZA family xanthine/uracil permease-like MFS transporter